MAQVNDKVLSAVILMQRVTPRLHPNDRETIKRQQLTGIQQTITMILQQLYDDCKKPLVLTPLMEVVELINNLLSDDNFVETDAETKTLIVDRVDKSTQELYLFAGQFYIDQGFYFGVDVELKNEGVI